jgi:hypothetical protein
LLANRAILGHVASGLAHEPDRSAVDGLGLTGANEKRIGRGHEPINVAFLWEGVCAAGLRLCETGRRNRTAGVKG